MGLTDAQAWTGLIGALVVALSTVYGVFRAFLKSRDDNSVSLLNNWGSFTAEVRGEHRERLEAIELDHARVVQRMESDTAAREQSLTAEVRALVKSVDSLKARIQQHEIREHELSEQLTVTREKLAVAESKLETLAAAESKLETLKAYCAELKAQLDINDCKGIANA